MKINQKGIQYILIVLILAIAVCAYRFGYMGYIEKANALKNENKNLESRIAELNDKESHRDEWVEETNQVDGNIKELLSKYGPGNTPEKSIIFVQSLEQAADMEINNISFNPDTLVFSDEAEENKTEMFSTFISINYSTTYDGLKACMDYINAYPERMNVSGFTASPNQETGQITGNMVINMYSVKDANHVYEEPGIAGVQLGTDNIFGFGYENTFNPEANLENPDENEVNTGEEPGEENTEGGDENPEDTQTQE